MIPFMPLLRVLVCLLVLVSSFQGATTQNNSTNVTAPNQYVDKPPDVYLNASVGVDLISLIIEKVNVSVNLDLKVANIVSLNAGVQASIEKINLTITNIRANAELTVRLDNVAAVVEDAVNLLAQHPEIITGLLDAVGGLLKDVVSVINTTVDALGRTLQTVVDNVGNIVERVLDGTGSVVSETLVGTVNSLQVLSSTVNSVGQYVTQVRATDGSLLQVTYDKQGGSIVGISVLQAAPSTTTTGASTTTTAGTGAPSTTTTGASPTPAATPSPAARK